MICGLPGFLLIWIYLIIYPVKSDAQIKHYQHLDVSDGLLTNQLTSLVEGPDGAIWITTNGAGICRYDGQSFQHFNDLGSVGTSYYYAVCVDRKELWFGGEHFILRRIGRENKLYALPGVGNILQILSFSDSLLFCVAEDSSFIMGKNSGKILPTGLRGIQINQVENHQESIWAATSSGVWQLDADHWHQRYPTSGSANNCSALLSSGTDLLVVDDQNGLVKIIEKQGSIMVPASAMPASEITFLKQGALGEIYFGTRGLGIQILQLLDSLWLSIDERQLHFNHVTAMVFDQWENAWVTTAGGGLTKFYSEAYSLYPSASLSGRYIRKMEKWGDTLAIQYNNRNWDIIANQQSLPRPIELLPGQQVQARCQTKLGFWYATDKKLIFERDSLFHETKIHDGFQNASINDMEEVDSLAVMVSTNETVLIARVDLRDTLFSLTSTTISNQPAKDLVKAGNGKIWFYNDREIGIYSDSNIVFKSVSSKPTCMISFDENTMLLGTRDAGLFFVDFFGDDIQMNAISTSAHPLGSIRALAIDNRQHLWIALQNEVLECRFTRSSPMEIIRIYGRESGLPRFEIYENALECGPNGHIYLGTSNGLLQIVSESNFQTVHGPVLSLIHFSTLGDRFEAINDSMIHRLKSISPADADLTMQFEAIDQRSPESISYMYQLRPKSLQWIESRSGGNFQFYGLPPDEYQFAVKAINRNGRSSEIIEIPFTILSPFYRHWWFIMLSVVLLLGFAYLFYRWRLNIQMKRNGEITDKLKTQNQVLRLEQAARRLQMNPHFIFNALQSIQIKIAEGDRDQARADLQLFSKLMRGYLDHAREEKILLEDEIALLNQYLQVEQSLKAGRFEYEIMVPDDIDPSFIEIPAMLLQPFVENAIKHGLPQNNIKGQIKITFGWFGKYLSCSITDNGPGMSFTKASSAHRSVGMDITRQRLKAFFNQTNLDPLVVDSQCASSDGVPSGTKIRVLLPIEF